MRVKGTITSWNDEKGYGFIKSNAGGERVFVHIKAFRNRSRRPTPNDIVSFSLSKDGKGRARAVNATLAGDRFAPARQKKSSFLPVPVAMGFLVIVGFAVAAEKVSPLIPAIYLAVSLATFTLYALDKSAAQRGEWRTQETTLHLLALAGGWPGALVAQQKLRHKSRKRSFQVVFWITVILNCSGFIWLMTPDGNTTFNALLEQLVNHPGVMSQVCGLPVRRAFNVEGTLCLPMADRSVSRIWLLLPQDERLEQAARQITNLQDVVKIERNGVDRQTFQDLEVLCKTTG